MGEEGTFGMSKKEREAMLVLERVVRGEMKLTEAAEVMSLSYRQSSRLKGRYEKEGGQTAAGEYRWIYARTTLFPRLGAGLGRQIYARGRTPPGSDQPARPAKMARKRPAI